MIAQISTAPDINNSNKKLYIRYRTITKFHEPWHCPAEELRSKQAVARSAISTSGGIITSAADILQ
jgi:hypothetical protein